MRVVFTAYMMRGFSERDALAKQFHLDFRKYTEPGGITLELAQPIHGTKRRALDVFAVEVEQRSLDQHENTPP